MSDTEDVPTPKICCYVYRHGKNKGSQCLNKVSRRDPKDAMCSSHYYRFGDRFPAVPPSKACKIESPKTPSSPAIAPSIKTTDEIEAEERENRFEERFLKEQAFQKAEQEYRVWRVKRLVRQTN